MAKKLVPTKRIPTADSDDLRDSLGYIHNKTHTPEGLHGFDQPRRSLVEHGMKARKIHDELASREPGYYNPCRACSGTLGPQFPAT